MSVVRLSVRLEIDRKSRVLEKISRSRGPGENWKNKSPVHGGGGSKYVHNNIIISEFYLKNNTHDPVSN